MHTRLVLRIPAQTAQTYKKRQNEMKLILWKNNKISPTLIEKIPL